MPDMHTTSLDLDAIPLEVLEQRVTVLADAASALATKHGVATAALAEALGWHLAADTEEDGGAVAAAAYEAVREALGIQDLTEASQADGAALSLDPAPEPANGSGVNKQDTAPPP